MALPAGTVAVVTGELTRYADFGASLAALSMSLPMGSKIQWARSSSVVTNLNAATELMDGEWLWVIGDDHVFPADTIHRLWAHGVDIVAPLCVRRQPPHDPIIYKTLDTWTPITLTELPHGLVEVAACGNGGMLIRRAVIEALESPWWRGGQIHPGLITEDLDFCQRARAAGFSVYVDTTLPLGHITAATVWPTYADGRWRVNASLGTQYVAEITHSPVAATTL